MFLIDADYPTFIQGDILTEVTRGDSNNRKKAELAAVSEMTSYLNVRYDIAKVFYEITTWDNDKQYQADVYVVHNNVIYKAVLENTGTEPGTDDTRWIAEDPRNPIIVMYCVYIALYHLHQALPGRKIPQLRIDNYDLAVKWLKMVATGKLEPNLPEPEDESKNYINYGSNTRRTNHY